LGPGGRCTLIESSLDGIPNKNTKDGVTIFRALGSNNPYEHLIIEQIRDVAIRTVNEAGDGTTTSAIIAGELIKNLFAFCKNNPKFSPQKVARTISKRVYEDLCKEIDKMSIKITEKNKDLLEKVATVSTNGDNEMAKAVIQAFDLVGFGSSSHVTIQELSGNPGYKADLIEGFPVAKGYEESIGKFHPMFINDQMHQRCVLDNPLFLLFDGKITDICQISTVLDRVGKEYAGDFDTGIPGKPEFKNLVIIAHSFGENVLNEFAFNFQNPLTINVLPLATPMDALINSQLQFLMDVSAFTGAKIFDMSHPVADVQPGDLGSNMTKIEVYRFRTTIVGEPDPVNIETRVNEIKGQAEQAASTLERQILEERMGKISNGIAQLKIYGASVGELKEKADRAEDAVCAVRAAISHGCVPGGCRVLLNLILTLDLEDKINEQVLMPSLLAPFNKLLDNAGYTSEENLEILQKLYDEPDTVYDVENSKFGNCKKLGLLDATLAVSQALKNAASIASVMGTLGGIICFPRDNELEKQDARDEIEFNRTLENAGNIKNEANERP
jgi:chaperonin GroEL